MKALLNPLYPFKSAPTHDTHNLQTHKTLRNHSFFWTVMTSPSNTNGPSGDLKAAIDGAFGSIDDMKVR